MTNPLTSGSCHCGAITFEARTNGRFLVECNCSICCRLGVLWLHAPPATATVTAPQGSTIAYRRRDAQGNGDITFHTCRICGCTTHYTGIEIDRSAVNMRLANPKDIAHLKIRHWDGADSWDWLDAPD